MKKIEEEIEENLEILESQNQLPTQKQDWKLFRLIHNYSGPRFDEYINRFLTVRHDLR